MTAAISELTAECLHSLEPHLRPVRISSETTLNKVELDWISCSCVIVIEVLLRKIQRVNRLNESMIGEV